VRHSKSIAKADIEQNATLVGHFQSCGPVGLWACGPVGLEPRNREPPVGTYRI